MVDAIIVSFAYAIKRTDDANSLILLFIMVNKNEVLLIQSLLFCLLQWPLTYAIYHMLSIVDNISSRSVKGLTESWFWFCCENQKVDFRVQVLLNVIAGDSLCICSWHSTYSCDSLCSIQLLPCLMCGF